MQQMDFPPLKPKTVLGIAAHPDDLDVGASGTMAAFAAAGADVYYLIITDGSKGSEDRDMSGAKLAKIRQDEQRAALKELGGKDVKFLGYPDGMLEVTMDLKRDLVRHIRTVRPDVVVTMDPSVIYAAERGFVNHPDHRAAGQATLDAVFPLARDHMSFPEIYAEGFEPHKTPTLLLINFNTGNFMVDVSDTFDQKLAALKAHASQFADMEAMSRRVRDWAEAAGKTLGTDYAESFVRLDIA